MNSICIRIYHSFVISAHMILFSRLIHFAVKKLGLTHKKTIHYLCEKQTSSQYVHLNTEYATLILRRKYCNHRKYCDSIFVTIAHIVSKSLYIYKNEFDYFSVYIILSTYNSKGLFTPDHFMCFL